MPHVRTHSSVGSAALIAALVVVSALTVCCVALETFMASEVIASSAACGVASHGPAVAGTAAESFPITTAFSAVLVVGVVLRGSRKVPYKALILWAQPPPPEDSLYGRITV